MTLLSRLLGLVRDIILAALLGASAGYDAFLMAFKIPNFFRRLSGEGAFSQAFVPVLAEYHETRDKVEVKQLIGNTCGVLAGILLVLTVVGMITAPWLVHLFAPGFAKTDPRFDWTVTLLRITFPYLWFISLTALFGGVLNTFGRFAVPAFTPVILNVCLIVAAVGFMSYFSLPSLALAWGVVVAGILQCAFHLPFLKQLDLVPRLRWAWHDPGVRRIFKLMLPAILGASVVQISFLIDTLFASFLPAGSISWLYYADRLTQFPLGMFGVALATVVLPQLSRHHTRAATADFSAALDWALRTALIIGLPAAIGLFYLAGPVIATLFYQGAAFSQHDVLMTRPCLMAFVLGLPAFILAKILVSAYYSQQDTRTPVCYALIALGVNTLGNALLIGPFQHVGLAIATSFSAMTNVSLLLFGLWRSVRYQPSKDWWRFIVQVTTASVLLALFLRWVSTDTTVWLRWSVGHRIVQIVLLVFGGMLVYFSSLWLSGLRWQKLTD